MLQMIALCAAGALALNAGATPLTDELAPISFMLGSWEVREVEYDGSGAVVEELQGGSVDVQPALRGSYVQMTAEPPAGMEERVDALMWLICADGEGFLGRGFTSEEPGMMTVRGAMAGQALVLQGPHPPPEMGYLFRVRLKPADAGEIEVRIDAADDEGGWSLRTREWWRRRSD